MYRTFFMLGFLLSSSTYMNAQNESKGHLKTGKDIDIIGICSEKCAASYSTISQNAEFNACIDSCAEENGFNSVGE